MLIGSIKVILLQTNYNKLLWHRTKLFANYLWSKFVSHQNHKIYILSITKL